jgi:hypothetical protein
MVHRRHVSTADIPVISIDESCRCPEAAAAAAATTFRAAARPSAGAYGRVRTAHSARCWVASWTTLLQKIVALRPVLFLL